MRLQFPIAKTPGIRRGGPGVLLLAAAVAGGAALGLAPYAVLTSCLFAAAALGLVAAWRITAGRSRATEQSRPAAAAAALAGSGPAAAEEALRQASVALGAIIDNSPLAIYACDAQGYVRSWNRAAEQVFGWSEHEVLNHPVPVSTPAGESLTGAETRCRRRDGAMVELSVWRAPLRDAAGAVRGSMTMAADVTERKLLQLQLQQALRMEAVGRLAGGVAHDFNNLLTVITGYAYMLLEDLDDGHESRPNAEEILRTVNRASALTSQLLAFSRRQVAQPRILDLNELLINMDKMLRRLIGEDIQLVTVLAPDAGRIHADPGQIEQVVMNLVVNSRDAMPGGGRITIETANVTLDEQYVRKHLSARTGSYVMLSVTDSGQGMDEETRAHIFEPFFTTKEQGKGTGLGLAQVYGIVKQSGSEIEVTSAPGHGTSIRLYVPRATGPAPADLLERQETDHGEGTETVLLVEDEDEVRRLVSELLVQRGYTVLAAAHPQDAIDICNAQHGPIDLLLTDVVMPQMSGRELAERTRWMRPSIKVLYMSGYTQDTLAGDVEPDAPFLRKPFTPAALTRAIREAIEARPQSFGAAAE